MAINQSASQARTESQPYSMWIWAVMVSVLGLAFLANPSFPAALFHLTVPASAVVWAKLFGLALVAYSCAYYLGAVQRYVPFMRVSVALRVSLSIVVGAMVATKQLPLAFVQMSALDLAGAIWTGMELRKRRSNAR